MEKKAIRLVSQKPMRETEWTTPNGEKKVIASKELEFSDGTRHDYAEKYVTTTQPWSVVGATCHHRWADSDVVLTVTAVGQYYGIKAESEDGKVKWTGLDRDFVPCTPDGRDLLPEPPAEVHIDAA